MSKVIRVYRYRCQRCDTLIEKTVKGREADKYEVECKCGGKAVKIIN